MVQNTEYIDRIADHERSRFPGRMPVPIEEVITSAEILIARNHYDGSESSFTFRDRRTTIIGLNTRISPRRQRFALAHAYGHVVLANSPELIVCQSVGIPKGGTRQVALRISHDAEADANWFAGSILMPADPLRDVLAAHLGEVRFSSRDELIKKMAAVFAVSPEAMGWRLISLNLIMA